MTRGRAVRRRIAAACVVVAMALAPFQGEARMRHVERGEVPRLDAGEGLVLVAVDTSVPLHSVSVNMDGKPFGSGVLRDLEEGRSYRLYTAPAGTYEWRQVRLHRRLRMELDDDPEFRFRVEPGRITYAGDLLFRPVSIWRAEVAVPNRSLAALDWMGSEHPAVLASHDFVYSGHYPDPFPAHYRALLASTPGFSPEGGVRLEAPPAPGPLPIPVDTLWRPGQVSDIAISPGGTLVAMQVRDDRPGTAFGQVGASTWAVELADMAAGSVTRIAESALPYDALQWSGDDALLVSMTLFGESKVAVMRAPLGADGKRRIEYWPVPQSGEVVDPLPDEPDHVLFAHQSNRGDLRVHRLDISSQASIEGFRPRMGDRLNVGVEDDVAWYTDGNGRLRLAMAWREDAEAYVLLHGGDGQFREVLTLSDEFDFTPLGLSHAADAIYGLTDEDRGQRDLVTWDLAQARIRETLFSRQGVDVVSAIFDERRTPIGVRYYAQGQLVSEYFDSGDQHLARLLGDAFPGRTVSMVDRSRDGRQGVLWVDAGDQPSQLYWLDAEGGRATLLEDSRPWLSGKRFAPTVVIPFQGAGGLAMEAFLTLPEGAGRRPLVVMPHGGPVGVADRRHFDPEVQFVASLGYAVLRVNFRGSEGYGRAFREAGHRAMGTVIEDDIDAAIQAALAGHPLDGERMCMVGHSYGGYSALVGAVRWPDRFRCAVSIAGVSDRILFFTASDGGRSEKGRELLEKVIGDPRTEADRMQATSPLYHHDRIRIPVMLAHGREDTRVDFEHTRRMARMLEIAGRPATGLVLEEGEHSLDEPGEIRAVWEGVAGFLRKHLGAPQG